MQRDLVVLGFFAALGKGLGSFLACEGIEEVEETLEDVIRYEENLFSISVFVFSSLSKSFLFVNLEYRFLEGACVLYFPNLGNLLRYQHFLDVRC